MPLFKSGALANFTESRNTATPNATIPAHQVQAAGTESNIDHVIAAKGTGAILTHIPDNTATGGNKRGTYSVDMQRQRSAAAQVASGVNSAIVGGNGNTASGNYSGCFAGELNTASGYGSYTFGVLNVASDNYAVAMGEQAVANKYAQVTLSAGALVTAGDAQTSVLIVRFATTDGTQTELKTGDNGRLTIATDTTWLFDIKIVARRTDADNESAGYTITGVIDNNAGTTALVGSITKTVIAEDTAAWDVTAEADNTNDALVIKVTGEAAKTINWVAFVRTVEVTG